MPIISGSSAALSSLPGFEIGYDQITGGVNIASTTEATPTTIIACAAHTFDGAPVLLTVFVPFWEIGSAAAAQIWLDLFESTTQIGRLGTLGYPSGTLQQLMPATFQYRFTPSAASHTYTVAAHTNSTTGTPAVGAGPAGTSSNVPAFARFTKV